MIKIIKYILTDIFRNRIVVAYTLILFAITFSVFALEDNVQKGLLTLLNIVLFIVPLVCIIFSTIYIYNCAEFTELLISQPIKRKNIWISLFSGLSSALSMSFILGVGIPLVLYNHSSTAIMLLLNGVLLSFVFLAIAMVAAVNTRDKAKGIGLSILLWLYFALLFDGILLFVLFQFADYPLEKIMLVFSALNPIDSCRIMILLKLDMSAMMGYTGAIFKKYYGTNLGISISYLLVLLWIVIPILYSIRKFNRKDL